MILVYMVKVPFERAWSREFKNVLLFVSIVSYAEKYISEGAEAESGPPT